jgi:DNA-binding NtrC family response regulator
VARILVVDDDSSLRRSVRRALQSAGHDVLEAEDGIAGLALIDGNALDLVITDLHMPRADGIAVVAGARSRRSSLPVLMLTGQGTTADCVAAMQAGACDFLIKPFHPDGLARAVTAALDAKPLTAGSIALVGSSPAIRELLGRSEALARTDDPVILRGESGTGAEAVARLIHGLSARGAEPFVVAAPNDPREWASADRGTLFVEEIADLSEAAWGALEALRATGRLLDRRSVDVRLMVATTRELGLARFEVLTLPPLRERPEDLPALVARLLDDAERRHRRRPTLTADALASLQTYGFPGNVAELTEIIEALSKSDEPIEPEHHGERVSIRWFDGSEEDVTLRLGPGETLESALAAETAEIERKGRVVLVCTAAIAVVTSSAGRAPSPRAVRVEVVMRRGAPIAGEIEGGSLRAALACRGPLAVHAGEREHRIFKREIVHLEELR